MSDTQKMKDLVQELNEKLTSAQERYADSKQTSINCYAAGYDLGCVDTLREVIDAIEGEVQT